MPEPKKKLKRKRKTRAKPGQVITQKVTVNIGKSGYGTKRRTGTQAKRSVQPQVIYQQQPIPLQPNYSSQLNDLRNEVRTHLSGVDKEDGRRRAIELREQYDAQMVQDELARRIAFQEGTQGTSTQTERAMTMETMSQTDKPAPRGRSSTERPAVAPAVAPPVAPAVAPPPEKVVKVIKKRGRPPGSQNRPKEAQGVAMNTPIQSAVLAGEAAEPVPQLIALEKERRSKSLGAAEEGQTTMDDFTFR